MTFPTVSTTACSWDVVIPFESLWEQYKRLIKPNGAIVLFGSQPFTSALVMSNPRWFKYEWIWKKNQFTGILNAKKQPLRNHENILIFYNKQPTYNPQFESYSESTQKRYKDGDIVVKSHRSTKSVYSSYESKDGLIDHSRGKYPGTIQSFKCVRNSNFNRLHPTQKPIELLQYLIKTYTNEGNRILDNTCGSGSTLVAAGNTGRYAVGIEKEEKYCKITADRCSQLSIYSIA